MRKRIKPADRNAALAALRKKKPFDVVIIGAGATGLGVAVDAASRGFSVAVVDAQDWAAGTSSRSTKLIHGGVRYMRNPRDWHLVREALSERRTLLQNCPELVRPMAFIVPCYRPLEREYYAAGVSLYTAMASDSEASGYMRLLPAAKACRALPGVRSHGLKGAIQFLDAQFDDARMAVALLHTAISFGAVALSYAPVTGIEYGHDRVEAVVVRDSETGEELRVRGGVFFNCTGPWTDSVRRMAYGIAPQLVRAARGSHIIVDRSFMPADSAMVVPKTTDKRILFCIPWHGMLEIGTTDIEQADIPFDPQPSEEEISFMIDNANCYLERPVRRADVRAAFTGLRPLFNPQKGAGGTTAKVSREHAVLLEFGNMITVTGGKWTSYRLMAEHAIRKAVEARLLPERGCRTRSLPLIADLRLDPESLEREAVTAGSAADVERKVCDYARHAVRTSGARTADDVLFRRLRIGMMDAARAAELSPVVAGAVAAAREELAASRRGTKSDA